MASTDIISTSILAHKYIFGGRIGTTSGRKLRRGPEMELRRVGRGQWRCPQYNFPIVRQLYFIFAFRISVFYASYATPNHGPESHFAFRF